MDYRKFLHRIPKIELHIHLIGCVRAETLIEIAAKNDHPLPDYEEPEDLYWKQWFFDVYPMVCHALRDADDFYRITYEAQQDGAAVGIRYREMFWSPSIHMADGITYQTALDGVLRGLADAEIDFGIQTNLIADIPRFTDAGAGVELVEIMTSNRHEKVIGLGMDFEYSGAVEKHREAYRMAKEAGLKLCGHCGQAEPAANVAYCIEELGFDRIDHGYSVVLDNDLLQRCVDEEIVYTVCPVITQRGLFPWELSKHPVREMINRGLKVTFGSDDPTMIDSDLTKDMILIAENMGYRPADFKQFTLNGIDACWLDEATRKEWRTNWGREIDALLVEVENNASLHYALDEENWKWSHSGIQTPCEERNRFWQHGEEIKSKAAGN